VLENLRRASGYLDITPDRLYVISQVHGTTAVVLDGPESQGDVARQTGDILVTRRPGVACAVRTADCVPVLLGDRRTGAVAAIHAGWRGTAARIIEVGVGALRELTGTPVNIVAALGPHIESCCFEVGEEVAAALAGCSIAGSRVVHRDTGHPRVDLRGILRAQLLEAGVEDGAIEDVVGCTVCDRARFFSFRRDGARTGRMLAAIVARGAA
jgi:YfiH family protein